MFKRTENDLSIKEVLKRISFYSLSDIGAKDVMNSIFITSDEVYAFRQKQISSAVFVLSSGLRARAFPSLESVFSLSNNENAEGHVLLDVASFIESAIVMKKLFDMEDNPDNPYSEANIRTIIPAPENGLTLFVSQVRDILDETGSVRETYPSLKALISKSESVRLKRSEKAKSLLQKFSSIAQADSAVMRDSRLLIPVSASSFKSVPGYVHSVSQSGETVFMEPFELVDMNNAYNLSLQEIQIETARLMGYLNNLLRASFDDLRVLSSCIRQADNIYSFAMWAKENNCCRVNVSDEYTVNLIQARHPLLGNGCVPVNVSVDCNYKAVVLSGPNAGGKTVTMKTVALFAYLNQICGYVPASDGSSLVLFDRIFTDIGDEQSIENSLSTFSGHMKNISFIMRNMTENSLVVLDEPGSGTDPQEGSCLARAMLEYCMKKCRLTFVTSHHGVLKQFAYASENILNASMEFNEETLEATFNVIKGLSGESHAIETAKRMHLPPFVINRARKYMGHEAVKISSVIKDLEELKAGEAELKDKARKEYELALKKTKELEDEIEKYRNREISVRQELYGQYNDFIHETRSEMASLVKQFSGKNTEPEKYKNVQSFVEKMQKKDENLKKSMDDLKKSGRKKTSSYSFKAGDTVLCTSSKREGVVVKVNSDSTAVVAIGSMNFTLNTEELVPMGKSKEKASYVLLSPSSVAPKAELDLRGYRLEEALECVKKQIESCCVHSVPSFAIIHGYGNGILSAGIHKYLSTDRNVKSYFFAMPQDGGQGKTYVKLE